MGGVLLKHINPDLAIGLIPITVSIDTAVVATHTMTVKPGFIHRLEKVTAQCASLTTTTVNVHRGAGGTILDAAITPSAGATAPAEGVIAAASVTALDQLGKADQVWRVLVIVAGAGSIVGGNITLWFRPYPCKGDVATVPATE
jgi:hypothetical protein